jgi:hypothetical protein
MALVLLPICQTLLGRTGREPPNVVVPALTSMLDSRSGRLTLSPAAETCSASRVEICLEVGVQLRLQDGGVDRGGDERR